MSCICSLTLVSRSHRGAEEQRRAEGRELGRAVESQLAGRPVGPTPVDGCAAETNRTCYLPRLVSAAYPSTGAAAAVGQLLQCDSLRLSPLLCFSCENVTGEGRSKALG